MEHFAAEAAFRSRITDRLSEAAELIEKEMDYLEQREASMSNSINCAVEIFPTRLT
jgi:hypothetical protein